MTTDRRKTYFGLLLLATMMAMPSCIRVEYEPCPPLAVDIVVKDKNYYNVNKVDLEDALPEDLPFRNYVSNLTYALVDIHTGDTMAWEPLFDVPADVRDFHIDFCDCIPYGTYVLTVWGGLTDDEPLRQWGDSLDLHPDGIVGGDPYLTRDTLVYDYRHSNHTVEMERIKGKLIVETEHLPATAVNSTNTISHLRNRVAPDFRYGGDITLTRQADWSAPGEYKVWKNILAPSIADKLSVLDLDFCDADGNLLTPILPKDVNITMNRNALTVLRYIWVVEQNEWIIYMLVNDNWEVVHGMIVD